MGNHSFYENRMEVKLMEMETQCALTQELWAHEKQQKEELLFFVKYLLNRTLCMRTRQDITVKLQEMGFDYVVSADY